MLDQITPLILTYNEEANIERTLGKLTWAKRIVIIDSFSDDATLDILQQYPTVKLFQRRFDTHAKQWNFGLQQIKTEWVLSLDADYRLSDQLIKEITNLIVKNDINYYLAAFKYCVFGKPLKGTILPPRAILFKKDKATYTDDGHTQVLQAQGNAQFLKGHIYHDDRKSLSRWLWAQDRYMIIEAKKLRETPLKELSWGDKIRKQKILAPWIIFIYCLIIKGGIFDGWRGWYYAFQRLFAEVLLSIRLIELELKNDQ